MVVTWRNQFVWHGGKAGGELRFLAQGRLSRRYGLTLCLGGRSKVLADMWIDVGGHHEDIAPEPFVGEPRVHVLRVHVLTEGADRGLPPDCLTAPASIDQGRLSNRRTVVYVNLECPRPAVSLDRVTLTRITLARIGVPQDEGTGQREVVAAFLARKGHRPQVTPGLAAVGDGGIEVAHAALEPAADLRQHCGYIRGKSVAEGKARAAERECRLGTPVAQGEARQQLACKSGNRRIIDTVCRDTDTCCLQRDHGTPREGVQETSGPWILLL